MVQTGVIVVNVSGISKKLLRKLKMQNIYAFASNITLPRYRIMKDKTLVAGLKEAEDTVQKNRDTLRHTILISLCFLQNNFLFEPRNSK